MIGLFSSNCYFLHPRLKKNWKRLFIPLNEYRHLYTQILGSSDITFYTWALVSSYFLPQLREYNTLKPCLLFCYQFKPSQACDSIIFSQMELTSPTICLISENRSLSTILLPDRLIGWDKIMAFNFILTMQNCSWWSVLPLTGLVIVF